MLQRSALREVFRWEAPRGRSSSIQTCVAVFAALLFSGGLFAGVLARFWLLHRFAKS